MNEIAMLVGLVAIIGIWFDSRAVSEAAVAACRQACQNAGVQFLDDIAPLWRFRLRRNANGQLRPERIFRFDYVDLRGIRRAGFVTLLGYTPIDIQLWNGAVH